ncbi:hypothetical protein RA28_10825 [Ruegeria sp. ANG-S4]|nr:hypothetical protein RA28_10825 [Ruegeria sp. ANG-S4]
MKDWLWLLAALVFAFALPFLFGSLEATASTVFGFLVFWSMAIATACFFLFLPQIYQRFFRWKLSKLLGSSRVGNDYRNK